MKHVAFILWIICVALCCSCGHSSNRAARDIERSFYFWKASWQPGDLEKKKMDSLGVKIMYIKYFDVNWDEGSQQPLPVAIISFKEKPAFTIIPVVFITNESLQKMDSAQIKPLSAKIITLISSINKNNSISSVSELQIDCDWSATTRSKYFQLLRFIKQQLLDMQDTVSTVQLSCTIRLYQAKYRSDAGIPPADKGLLMCYNMGNLKKIESNNSIIEIKELKKYTDNLSSYPLALDIALPIFNWKVWFRNDRYRGITEAFPDSLLSSPVFIQNGNRYRATKDTLLAGYEFKKDDLLRYEFSQLPEINGVADEISRHLKNTHCRVSLYHLDAVLLSKYSAHELENIYDRLR
jgi:hypothetical protein